MISRDTADARPVLSGLSADVRSAGLGPPDVVPSAPGPAQGDPASIASALVRGRIATLSRADVVRVARAAQALHQHVAKGRGRRQ